MTEKGGPGRGGLRAGGKEGDPCRTREVERKAPPTHVSQLGSSQTVLTRDLAKRYTYVGNSFHLGSGNLLGTILVAKFRSQNPFAAPLARTASCIDCFF